MGKTAEAAEWEKAASTLEGWTDVGRTTADPLPIVQGHRGIDGTVRVNESELEPGRYRVEFEGEILGEIRVTDPVIARKSNRRERRENGGGQRKYKLPPHALGGLHRGRS